MTTYVVLRDSRGQTFYVPTTTMNRPDLARGFGDSRLSAAGFRATVSATEIAAGEYQLSVVMDAQGRSLSCGDAQEPAASGQ